MPSPTVRLLLTHRELALGLLTPEDALPRGALDADIAWVHSSDLADPTPFLTAGQVLLTTGTQFGPAADDTDYDGYVVRLLARGVVGLGFGTEVIRETPLELIGACLRAGMPLLEVPYRTPFIAVARYAADLVAEQTYARNTWALAAQRAVSLAALRTDGLTATLAELARQLGRWVALVDPSGAVVRVFPARALTASARASIEAEAQRMLRARRRAASTVAEAGTVVSLQTIGASDRLLGVLAHGGPGDVDQAAQQVVTSVVALAGLALEQGRALASARDTMRASLLHTLDEAHAIADELGTTAGLSQPELDGLADARSRVDASIRRDRAATRAVGSSAAESETASASASKTAPGSRSTALLAALDDEDARSRAATLLAPLTARDHDGVLARSLLTWLDHNGVYDAAARELGVHRHTLTTRIRTAEQALGRDLDSFANRVELWAALRATDG